ncbi:hypothetical protein GGS21DRAFT_518609 [Xylaria nigripes]|nr:hypothetical protein GGS21DRAFT_518609 [Xylaria nigripes]
MHRPLDQPRRPPQHQGPELNQRKTPTGAQNGTRSESCSMNRTPVLGQSKQYPVSNHNRHAASAPGANLKRTSQDSLLDNDDSTDTEKTEFDHPNARPTRDSHDLSLPTKNFTRDSLLGNMLNSLDQFSLSQINTPIAPTFEEEDDDDDDDDGDPYGVPRGNAFSRSITNTSRITTNTYSSRQTREHGYNIDSDYDEVLEDIGGGGSVAPVSPTQRRDHAVGGRSSSFDCGQRPSLGSPGPWKTEFSHGLLIDQYDAAPNPTIPSGPGGPIRNPAPSSASNRPLTPLEYESQSSERKKYSRSRSGTDKTVQSKYATLRESAPMSPPDDVGAAPAPHFGYVKSKDAHPAGPTSAQPIKEKQGFFSRLFGSSRSSATSTIEQPTPITTSVANEPIQQVVPETKALSAPPTRDSESSRPMPHVVQKKSSFFRRRKKSNAEPPVPPLPPPLSLDTNRAINAAVLPAEASPVSSLREVMTPYLRESIRASMNVSQNDTAHARGTETDVESNRKVRGFSPDYEPSPSATIRTVKSTSALKNKEARWRCRPESPTFSPPDVPAISSHIPDATFFHDSSDEGEGVLDASPKPRRPLQTGDLNSQGATHKSKMASLLTGPEMPRSETAPNLLSQKSTSGFDQTQINLEAPKRSMQTPAPRPTLSRSGSNVPSVIVDSSRASPHIPSGPLDEPEVTVGDPTEDDRQKAQGIFNGDENFIQKEKAASWMGEEGLVRQRTLRAYMDLYNFENQSVLTALRQVCSRLILRAETQQVDRILVAFSNRWCICNPNHGFKTIDVIHTMCYSIMLLNTDLHVADIEQKMTRNQFLKNTMSTIIEPFENLAADPSNQSGDQSNNSLLTPTGSELRTPTDGEQDKSIWRASFRPLPRSESSQGSHGDGGSSVDACGPLVKAPFDGPLRAWETQMEIVLKDIYNSIRDEKLPLFGANPNPPQPQSNTGLPMIGKLRRSPSVLSKAPSEGQGSVRGRMNEPHRMQGSRWHSKSRSRPRLPNGFSSSRTSFEDTTSIWSPATSSATWSRQSLGRTQTSMSVDSLNSGYPIGDYQQSIGFANALSQAIIRDDYPVLNSSQSIMSDEFQNTHLLDDESLELLGPPWVKEGIVTHKHHLDGVDKKAKDRNWSEVFAVVQKGTLSIFSFSSKSMRQKARTGRKHAAGAVVGGGNWQENATNLGSFSLRHTLASALPAPGYSRSRPHVWALSLPSGAVHLFQVGTPEISKEFILTVNYWSARLSTHPLIGGISNIEYGWSDAVINSALIGAMEEPSIEKRPGSAAAGRTSTHSRQGSRQSSLRSSFDVGGGARTKLPGDRIHIAEWTPPSQSLRPSQCSESEQLKTLQAYVNSMENEFQQHNQLRSPMLLAYTPRGLNAVKSMANWERKSSYLLREIVKFRTYVDSLLHAAERRKEVYAERENARRAARGEDIEDSESEYGN